MALAPRWTLPRWVRLTWSFGLTAFAAVVAIAVVLDRQISENTAKFVHNNKLQISLVIVLSAWTIVDAAIRNYRRSKAPALQKQRVDIRNQLGQVIAIASSAIGCPAGDLGCGLFVVRPKGLWRVEQLVRVERVRLVNNLYESHVVFTKGKGTVGECWQKLRPATKDWRAINEKYGDLTISEHQWGAMRPNVTRGFSLEEFQSMVGKYAEVAATPITVEGKFVGCLALDLRWNKAPGSVVSKLDKPNIETLLGGAAQTIVPVLFK